METRASTTNHELTESTVVALSIYIVRPGVKNVLNFFFTEYTPEKIIRFNFVTVISSNKTESE
jgi:hypothetical protein